MGPTGRLISAVLLGSSGRHALSCRGVVSNACPWYLGLCWSGRHSAEHGAAVSGMAQLRQARRCVVMSTGVERSRATSRPPLFKLDKARIKKKGTVG